MVLGSGRPDELSVLEPQGQVGTALRQGPAGVQ